MIVERGGELEANWDGLTVFRHLAAGAKYWRHRLAAALRQSLAALAPTGDLRQLGSQLEADSDAIRHHFEGPMTIPFESESCLLSPCRRARRKAR